VYWYIFKWLNPQCEGQSEGDYIEAEEAKSLPEALGKALAFLDKNVNAKVEIIQVTEPWPDEYIG